MEISSKKKFILLIGGCLLLFSIALILNFNQFSNVFGGQDDDAVSHPEGITLKQEEVELKIGDSFDASEYIESAYDANGNDVTAKIEIEEFINTSQVAQYEVTYELKTNEGKKQNAVLKVKVIK